jgi:hypothetical protein
MKRFLIRPVAKNMTRTLPPEELPFTLQNQEFTTVVPNLVRMKEAQMLYVLLELAPGEK